MRVLYKWDAETGAYMPYTVPEYWKIPVCSPDPDTVINCASCGEELRTEYAYESKEILFTPTGKKTLVCMECYYRELYQKRIVRKEIIEE